MKSFRVPAAPFLAALLLVSICGCARSPDDSYSSISLTGDFAAPFQILTDNFVRRQKPAIYVHPQQALNHKPTALFVPLRMVQQVTNAVTFSDMLSRQIWQVWLSLGIFQTLEFMPSAGPFDRARALALARQKGAEVLVGGYINHYFDGGQGAESSISLAIEVYDVQSGNMIWSISQGGLMEKEKKHDFYLFTITERNPADPSGLIARSLAWDMGQLLLKWVNPYSGTKPSLWNRVAGGSAF
ncbi:MAG: hypothetical protein HDQ44_03615 [Desulfovibrio sp.]|nr:hypothetical protein [Desulfovibrio sp.]